MQINLHLTKFSTFTVTLLIAMLLLNSGLSEKHFHQNDCDIESNGLITEYPCKEHSCCIEENTASFGHLNPIVLRSNDLEDFNDDHWANSQESFPIQSSPFRTFVKTNSNIQTTEINTTTIVLLI